MFPEYREKITELKQTNVHFKRTFDKHNILDEEIKELDKHYGNDDIIKQKKKEKLKIKEELHKILKES